jgi:hypothetical protein
MTDDTSAYISATADTLGLDIEPEWRENVTRFFVVAREMAAFVAGSGALTACEHAPVFVPRDGE